MNLKQIHHVAIIVSDYPKSKDFYVNKLGFSIIRENYRPERGDWKLDLRVNDHTELEIFGVTNHNIEETVKELEEKGIEVEPVRVDEYSGGRFTFFKDPDGLPLELHE